ncbi:MAG: radical SAM protein [Deltaproteobacteria bacterium]|nr:radical SAM protein [Deltaproteobacteria bacterium]
MEHIVTDIKIKAEGGKGRVVSLKGTKMRFSAHLLFAYDKGPEDKKCMKTLAGHLASQARLAFYGNGRFLDYMLAMCPGVRKKVRFIIADNPLKSLKTAHGIPVVPLERLPSDIKTVFLCETLTVGLMRMRKRISEAEPEIRIITPEILGEIEPAILPKRAFIPDTESIYPIDIPEIRFREGLELILIDCPSRNLDMMPNGLAYVHNALKSTGIKFETVDLDPIVYHRYHTLRLLDSAGGIVTKTGCRMKDDPWAVDGEEEWQKAEVIEYFLPEIREVSEGLIKANPKILALSVQSNNIRFSREVVKRVKKGLPDTLILVGGYSCYYPTLGPLVFPDYDYMVIGEGDLTVGPLVSALIKGERPKDIPGVISRFDSPKRRFTPGKAPEDLDSLEMPGYDWAKNLEIYRNYNHYQLTPVTGSRGCRWARCRFCAERFFWRSHSPKRVADEIAWLNSRGCDLFQFNESDFNGDPGNVLAICDEIIRRGLRVKLTGQLRIDKRNDLKFFEKLKEAGFVSIRFGVDAWAPRILKLQNKGYTTDMISRNLMDCRRAGISNEVNIVIGVPGESEEDIKEGIELLVGNKPYIDRVANINPLMLMHGSIYWLEPEKYNISFRGDKGEIYGKYPSFVPPHLWYSTHPYIDEKVRKDRFEMIVEALYKNGMNMGGYAEHVVKNVRSGRGAEASARPDSYDGEITHGGGEPLGSSNGSGTAPEVLDEPGGYSIVSHGGEFYKVEGAAVGEVLEVKRDYSPYIHLVREGFHGYNIVEVKRDFYGIKQGHPFDKDKADRGGCGDGVCFKGRNSTEVERLIAQYDAPQSKAAVEAPPEKPAVEFSEGLQCQDGLTFFRRADFAHPPKLSIILLDWSVRESFHVLEYLNHQAIERDSYEIVWIEFYGKRAEGIDALIKKYGGMGRPSPVDTWIAMGNDPESYYHKHRMYNTGILNSSGELLVFMDSDAIVRSDFVRTLAREFERGRHLALHLEEIRNFDKKFHPFNFPPIGEIIGAGCVNAAAGVPNGLGGSPMSLKSDLNLWHVYNYGACFACRREDIIRIGGADEHEDYLGHICGPYEMTARLINAGIPDKLHPAHFLYHAWHPNQGGDNNYCGPNNGKGMSLTAMEIPASGRVLPLLENTEIKKLRLTQEEALSRPVAVNK